MGGDHRDLLALHRGHEGGAQGNLGLAEADIAADQSVHRPPAFEVAEHVGDGAILIVGLFPGKAVGELSVGTFLCLQHRRLAQGTRGGGLQQLVGDLADSLAHFCASPLPGFAAEPVELDRVFGRAVAAQHVDVLDRDEQLIAPGILEHHAVVRALADLDRLESEIFPDAVLGMDHQIAAIERAELGEEGVGVLALLAPPDQPVTEHVLLGQQFELVVGEAGLGGEDQRHRLASGRGAQRILPALGELDRDAGFLENGGDARAAAGRVGGEQRPLTRLAERLQMIRQNGIDVVATRAFGGEIAARAEAEVDHLAALGLGEAGGAVDRPVG